MVIYKQAFGGKIRQLSERPMIIYEQPLTEKIRLLMRLELLVKRFQTHLSGEPRPEDTVAALHLLLDLYNLSARQDVKNDILKELDRVSQSVRLLMRNGETHHENLDATLESLSVHSDILYQQRGQLGQHLTNHTFFNSLRQRSSLPGGLNGFDIPLFHYWQSQLCEMRLNDLKEWAAPYITAHAAASAVLNVIRDFAESREEVGVEGFFQCALDVRKPYQLMRIKIPSAVDYYPEISAGKQRFTLRFLSTDALAERGKQHAQDVPFTLLLCTL